MAHNKLRRDISDRLNFGGVFHPLDVTRDRALLERALGALGGPVTDNRPQVETVTPVVDTPPTAGEMMTDVVPEVLGTVDTVEPDHNN